MLIIIQMPLGFEMVCFIMNPYANVACRRLVNSNKNVPSMVDGLLRSHVKGGLKIDIMIYLDVQRINNFLSLY